MTSASPGAEPKPHDDEKQVTVLVVSGASGNWFDDQIVPELKRLRHCVLQDYSSWRISARRHHEGFLKGFVTYDPTDRHPDRFCDWEKPVRRKGYSKYYWKSTHHHHPTLSREEQTLLIHA